MMTLRGLKSGVKKLARGKYYSIKEEITEYSNGKTVIEYRGYIHDLDWTDGYKDPKEVLHELREMIEKKEGD